MLCAWMWMELGQHALCVDVDGARATGSVRGGGGCHGQQALYVDVEGATGNRLCTWRLRELVQRALCLYSTLQFCVPNNVCSSVNKLAAAVV